MDKTFAALSDPTRRAILMRLRSEPGLSVSELAKPFPLKLPGMMKHLGVLSDAGLISRRKRGRVVSVELLPEPLKEVGAWIAQYEQFWSGSLDRLALLVEEKEPE
jgi:DNA-binding transcriptional ArsR family regulator